MKIFRRILILSITAVLLAGCCHCRSYQRKTRRPLVGTEWRLIQIDGKSMTPETGKFTLTFHAEQQRLTGVGACNRLSGSYTADATRALKIHALASTRMACPDMADEQAFVAALEATTHYDMDGPMLMLLADGELRAVFQAVPQPAEKKE